MSAKLIALLLLKIKTVLYKVHAVIISVHDVTKKVLSGETNDFVDVVMWPKFGNSSNSMRELKFYKDLTRKKQFFEGWTLLKFSDLGLVLGINLKSYVSVTKWSKLTVRKLWELIPTFGDGTEKNW